VFQDYALFPNLNVLDNICFGPAVQGWERGRARARGEELLELVHLRGYERRRVHTLSGGERQRVALARALAPRPRLLLLDEPLSALDAKLRLALRREIQAVQRELGVTTVYVTHDQEEALAISDRIAVMRDGCIEQLGTPQEVYRRPSSLFVAAFLGQANLVPAAVVGSDGRSIELDTPLGRFRAAGDGRPAAGQRLALFFRPEAAQAGTGRGRNSFRGRILRREYLGSQVQAEVEAGGLHLVVLLPEEAGAEPGRAIALRVDPESCRLLPVQGASFPGS
jgi:ABC-type Fe3+/spermidine/putrescine transport system ATPase subunit